MAAVMANPQAFATLAANPQSFRGVAQAAQNLASVSSAANLQNAGMLQAVCGPFEGCSGGRRLSAGPGRGPRQSGRLCQPRGQRQRVPRHRQQSGLQRCYRRRLQAACGKQRRGSGASGRPGLLQVARRQRGFVQEPGRPARRSPRRRCKARRTLPSLQPMPAFRSRPIRRFSANSNAFSLMANQPQALEAVAGHYKAFARLPRYPQVTGGGHAPIPRRSPSSRTTQRVVRSSSRRPPARTRASPTARLRSRRSPMTQARCQALNSDPRPVPCRERATPPLSAASPTARSS